MEEAVYCEQVDGWLCHATGPIRPMSGSSVILAWLSGAERWGMWGMFRAFILAEPFASLYAVRCANLQKHTALPVEPPSHALMGSRGSRVQIQPSRYNS
jgi:hypothetical protein